MAFDFSQLNFFSKLGARSRVFVLLGGVVGMIGVVYLGVSYFSSGTATTGASKVANAPQGLQSVPGGQLTPEYYRALQQANQQAAQQAQISGGSAVATLVNVGQPSMSGSQGSCNVICSDTNANVKYLMDDWVKQGKMSPETSAQLQKLADANVSEAEYAAMLDGLVKSGKLTPEQARQLLEQYRKQHGNAQLQESGSFMDDQIKAGNLPLEAAATLLDAQKKGASVDDYAAMLHNMVAQGKISDATAQQLLGQYSQQRAKEVVAMSVTSLKKMADAGQITPEVRDSLITLETQMVSVDEYNSQLQTFVQAGKLIPATANKILDEFKYQKSLMGSVGSVGGLLKNAEDAAYGEIADLLKDGKISQATADQLRSMLQQNVSMDQFKAAISDMTAKGQLTPDIAKLKLADYTAVKGLRDLQAKLLDMQANNASPDDYQNALKAAVAAGLISSDQATQLMNDFNARNALITSPAATGNVNPDFAALQQRLQQAQAATGTGANFGASSTPSDFSDAAAKALAAENAARQTEISTIASNMANQAQSLLAAWQPVPMQHQEGTPATAGSTTGTAAAGTTATGTTASTTSSTTTPVKPSLIKAGQILFAVLDTAANSDYPTSPVMATVVDGKYKGAKLIGTLVTQQGVSGQMDRVSLNFTLMNMSDWPTSRTVTAYAIDPDTARTVLASSVDYHYMQRFGAIMATSFVQGYANAIQTSASTSTTGIFGTSTTHPELSPSQKLASGLGQVGQALGTVTQNYTNIPPTVKVNAGVGLGILFMADVSE